jgi:hypothetical protein
MNNINFFFVQKFSWDLVHIIYNAIGHCVNLQATTMELWWQNLHDLMQPKLNLMKMKSWSLIHCSFIFNLRVETNMEAIKLVTMQMFDENDNLATWMHVAWLFLRWAYVWWLLVLMTIFFLSHYAYCCCTCYLPLIKTQFLWYPKFIFNTKIHYCNQDVSLQSSYWCMWWIF